MDRARLDRLQSIFLAVADQPRAHWRAQVERAAADDPSLVPEVMAMLAAESAGSLLDRGVARVAGDLVGHPPGLPADPGAFRPYRLDTLLGEGGMGVVYRASRDDLGSHVAIKILRDGGLSPSRRERFLAEQRTLAGLIHPGIARLYDAQTLPDGTPWFVMEYVDGAPITDHCRDRGTSLEERLRLFRSVSEAVAHAHRHDVIHRDLKPSNIFVKPDGTVRLLDFGIAKRLEPDGDSSRTTLPLMTPAYAAPEQLRGESAGIRTDIFSLGVILYELVAGRLPFGLPRTDDSEGGAGRPITKPSVAAAGASRPRLGTAAWEDLDLLCLTAMHGDPSRRYRDVPALIRDVDHFLAGEPLEARPDAVGYRFGRFVRRKGRALAAAVLLVAAGGASALLVSSVRSEPRTLTAARADRTVAVLPFESAVPDSTADHLRLALPEELVAALDRTRGLTVRSLQSTTRYADSAVELKRVARETGAATVVRGRIERRGGGLLIRLEAIAAATGDPLWRDTVAVDPGDPMALRTDVARRAAEALAVALGIRPARSRATEPRNREAYALYLRSVGGRYDPGPRNEEGIRMLERAVTLDSGYAPAWLAFARRLYIKARFETGASSLMDSSIAATERALSLDPDYATAGARLAGAWVERGRLGDAWRTADRLLERRPDSPEAHFAMSYVLRHAGLMVESARECSAALSLDPHNFGWRSCAVALIAQGDYDGAQGFLDLDAGSEFSKALRIHMLVRAGNVAEALGLGPPKMPQWTSYSMLLSCLTGGSEAEIAAGANAVVPSDDPESNYFAAAHLSYCGRAAQAIMLLQVAVRGHYCAFPVMDTDPFLANAREHPGYPAIRSAGEKCQRDFLAERERSS